MKLNIIALEVFLCCYAMTPSFSPAESYFDPGLLMHGSGIDVSQLDLNDFANSNTLTPGEYDVMVNVNLIPSGEFNIAFDKQSDGQIAPVFTVGELKKLGVNTSALPKLRDLSEDAKVEKLSDYIADATITFDPQTLTVNLSVPQIAMVPNFAGYVPPELRDDGVTALVMDYVLNYSNNRQLAQHHQKSSTSDSLFANLNAGINMGAWRLRTSYLYNYSKSSGSSSSSDSSFTNTYVYRTINAIKSTLRAGEISTGGNIFDSIPMKGATLKSNPQLDPSSMQGFAPVVEGFANTNATVTVRQNGSVVYQTFVAPGRFIIRDIPASGLAGDMEVTVEEEDGKQTVFTQAYSSLPMMERQGSYNYEVSAGRYNGGITVGSERKTFALGSFSVGLPYNITTYGGLLVSNGYNSVVGGIGLSLGVLGALSTDVTHSDAKFSEKNLKGQSYRIRYSKSLLSTGTSFDLTALRYTTENFYSFSDYNNAGYTLKDGLAPWTGSRQRYSFQTSINQSFDSYGSLSLRASKNTYWGGQSSNTSVGMSYNNNFRGVSYSLSYMVDRVKSYNNSWPENRVVSFDVSVPLSLLTNSEMAQTMSARYGVSVDNHGDMRHQAGLTGSAMNSRFSYGLYQNYDSRNSNYGGSVNGTYSGNNATLSTGYSYSDTNRSMNGTLSGGLVAHSDGVTLSPNVGDTIAIITADGAKGAALSMGAQFDRFGNAVIPQLASNTANQISVNVNTLPDDITFKDTSMMVYPTEGAVIKRHFKTKVGYQAMVNLTSSGKMPPFGAIATLVAEDSDDNDINTGIVGSNGQLYMSGLPDTGRIHIQWGGDAGQCTVNYSALEKITITADSPVRTLNTQCQ
ncbi:fimbria/pilus outer membrane usher protein [Providencia rettgeri]|uniref:fimbria/pilus outer membrane usher protein n=6 Tax=Providencia TaxID=586 RepID=UPI001B395C6E|nr:fimbria/pilus outer membrane usher protein [Providencia rettgeri]MBQ0368193.1 fimbrial biogenesis outer membrane usher protein [Providencia rettgeri]